MQAFFLVPGIEQICPYHRYEPCGACARIRFSWAFRVAACLTVHPDSLLHPNRIFEKAWPGLMNSTKPGEPRRGREVPSNLHLFAGAHACTQTPKQCNFKLLTERESLGRNPWIKMNYFYIFTSMLLKRSWCWEEESWSLTWWAQLISC